MNPEHLAWAVFGQLGSLWPQAIGEPLRAMVAEAIRDALAEQREACAAVAEAHAAKLRKAKDDGGTKWAEDLEERAGDCDEIAAAIRDLE